MKSIAPPLVIFLCILLVGTSASALTGTYSGGTGSSADPAQISSVADLLELAATEDDYGEHFILTTPLDLSGQNFTSAVIAKDTDSDPGFLGALFSGSFNGGGHTISNLTINTSGLSTNDYLGLFGGLEGVSAEVVDLTLANVSITTGNDALFIGGLCGFNDGTLRGCSVSGTLSTGTDSETSGGLCGQNLNQITNCQSSVALHIGDADESRSGGLCGWNQGTIDDCSSSGSVSGDGVNKVGAFCGMNNGGTIRNSSASGSATGGASSSNIGGFCGVNDSTATLEECRASSAATGHNNTGGLVGLNSGEIQECYATGNLTMIGDEGYGAGGLIGENEGAVTNSYSIGALTLPSTPWAVGGLVGANEGGAISASFWNTESSGQSSSAGGTGLPTAQMQTQSTFTSAGWDFSNVWKMDGYPVHLSAAPAPVQLISIEVGGPITVEEGTSEPYSCMAFYTDGSSNDVTQVADWSVTPTNYASISSNGVLTALSVSSNLYIDVQAVYTDATGSDTDTLEILVIKPVPQVSSIQVAGPNGVAEESNAQYTCFAFYTDDSSNDVTQVTDWSISPTHFASINSNGLLTTFSVSTSLPADIQAVYTDAYGSYTNTLEILIINDEGFYNGGSGTETDPYRIRNKADLLQLRNTPTDYHKYFALTANIDLTGEVFTNAVIAPNSSIYDDYSGTPFRGSFDGQEYIISNLTINVAGLPANNFLGLFGRTDQPLRGDDAIPGAATQTVIRNLAVENVSISSGDSAEFIGGLVGQNDGGMIYNCEMTGTLTGENNSGGGGLCGENTAGSMISNCQATASLLFDDGGGGLVLINAGTLVDSRASCVVFGGGGLVSYNTSGGQILSCHSEGSVTSGEQVGGLCGKSYNNTVISNCYSRCSVSGSGEFVGGLCGEFSGTIIVDSYATGDVSVSDDSMNIGGLIGGCYGIVTRCYATGNITCSNSLQYAGGLCGIAGYNSDFSRCYATGDITISGESYSRIGGFCGGTYGDISYCYSIGSLNLGTSLYRVGGFLGEQPYGFDLVDECFWDIQTSGMTFSAGGTGKTTAEMQAESTFTTATWDFDTVWYMHGYPELQAFDDTEKIGYLTWAENEGIPLLERGPEDTPANDDIPNLIKYAVGLVAMTPHLPTDVMSIATENRNGFFSIIYSKSKTAAEANLLPVWANGLDSEWIPEGITHELIETIGDMERWKVSIPLQIKGFMKLQVSLPE